MSATATTAHAMRADTPRRHLSDAAQFSQSTERALQRTHDRVDHRDRPDVAKVVAAATELRRSVERLQRTIQANRKGS